MRLKYEQTSQTCQEQLVKRLEKLEIVEVKKIGLENQVVLKK